MWNKNYAAAMIKCCLSFFLLCSAICCARGSRSLSGSFGRPVLVKLVELVQAETGLSLLTDL